jgi:hypothetical protein
MGLPGVFDFYQPKFYCGEGEYMEDVEITGIPESPVGVDAGEGGEAVGFEEALSETEADVNAALKAAASAVGALKKFRLAVGAGNMRDLNRTMESAGQAIAALGRQFDKAREGWNFDAESYAASRKFTDDILKAAAGAGVDIFEQDERLYCYPAIISILPNEMSVKIDKQKERRLRPSFLAAHLKALQNKPVRFKSEVFLEGLYLAWEKLVASRGAAVSGKGQVIPLTEIYSLLTIMPGMSREYSQQEFARDIYLLDQSGIAQTRKGFVVSLPASTGTKSPRNTVRVITRDGSEKKYYGIAFTEG